ncbi:hypothetical protein [Nocardia arizonensis]|uniref:hypothetical protein n=1 Tax=Nocardia arizonensis TaxID=1141647 RepID=UPI0012E1B259|nr:hypothetical protein [Nocardia arizonensis]
MRSATRSARYALITALCAAVISSGVSAGSAVYVSRSELSRKETATAAQMVRDNRKPVYVDFADALLDYTEGVSRLKGELIQNPPDMGELGGQFFAVKEKVDVLGRAMVAMSLMGSNALGPALQKFSDDYYLPFLNDHFSPFWMSHFGPAGTTADDIRRDGPPLIVAIDRMIGGTTDLLTRFTDQARKDLGIPDR